MCGPAGPTLDGSLLMAARWTFCLAACVLEAPASSTAPLASYRMTVSIDFIEWMATDAARLSGVLVAAPVGERAARILSGCYRFKMRWVDASADLAEMVKLEACGDRPNYLLVEPAMRLQPVAVIVVPLTISIAVEGGSPQPAALGLLHFRPEALFDGTLCQVGTPSGVGHAPGPRNRLRGHFHVNPIC